jgi:hypothetical protein
MAMPKAAVDENNGSMLRQYQIGCSRQILVVQSKSKSKRVSDRTDDQFGLSILASDVLHHPASH